MSNESVHSIVLAVSLGVLAAPLIVQDPRPEAAPPGQPQRVYVFFQRAPSHIRDGRPESFREVADAVEEELKAGNVSMASDATGGNTYSEGDMPLSLVEDIAGKAGATSLLYVVVERPHTRWLKVTLHLYDAGGLEMWSQEASAKAYLASTGNRQTIDRVHVIMKERIGGPGLPVATKGAGPAPTPAAARQ